LKNEVDLKWKEFVDFCELNSPCNLEFREEENMLENLVSMNSYRGETNVWGQHMIFARKRKGEWFFFEFIIVGSHMKRLTRESRWYKVFFHEVAHYKFNKFLSRINPKIILVFNNHNLRKLEEKSCTAFSSFMFYIKVKKLLKAKNEKTNSDKQRQL